MFENEPENSERRRSSRITAKNEKRREKESFNRRENRNKGKVKESIDLDEDMRFLLEFESESDHDKNDEPYVPSMSMKALFKKFLACEHELIQQSHAEEIKKKRKEKELHSKLFLQRKTTKKSLAMSKMLRILMFSLSSSNIFPRTRR